MTPEERQRYAEIDAKLQFTANLLQRHTLRHAGLRGMYRQGVNRFEEMLDRQERQDILLASLMESQLRTEASLNRLAETSRETEAILNRLAESSRETEANLNRLTETAKETEANLNRLAETFQRYLKSHNKPPS